MFDIMKEAASDTADLELNDKKGQPMLDKDGNRVSITICGPGSKTHSQAKAESRRRARARAEKANGNVFAALDNSEDDELHFLSTITVSFNGWEFPHPGEGKWKSKQEMFKAAYAEQKIGFVREQVERFQADWGNF